MKKKIQISDKGKKKGRDKAIPLQALRVPAG